jgi:hypothetical protein
VSSPFFPAGTYLVLPFNTGPFSGVPGPAADDDPIPAPAPGLPNRYQPGPAHVADTRAGETAPTKPGRTGPAHAFLRSENFPGPRRVSRRNFPGKNGRTVKFYPLQKSTAKNFPGRELNAPYFFPDGTGTSPKKIGRVRVAVKLFF